MPNVLLTGTFNSLNKGDAAMVLSAARAIAAQIEGVRVVISSPFPQLDAPFYAPIEVVPSSRRRLIGVSWLLARAWLRRGGGFLLASAEARAFAAADVVVDLSGDMLTEAHGPHLAYSHLAPIMLALALRRPVFVCAQSIGPFALTRPLARAVLNRVDRITARDKITLERLRELGVTNRAVSLTADLAFLLESAGAARVDGILRAEGVAMDGAPVVGVSLSGIVAARHDRLRSRSGAQRHDQLLADAIDRIAGEHNLRVVFVPHVTGPALKQDDRIVCRRVRERMKREARVIEGDYRPEELKGVIARCALFIGARMHANIAALSSGVPVVAIAYSHKAPGIMAMLGQDEFVIPVGSLTRDELVAMARRALERRAEIAEPLRRRLVEVQAASRANIRIVAELLGRRPARSEGQAP